MIFKLFFFFSLLINSLFAQNNLASETSPYLLQHKDNPVNWYAWGEKAFEAAKKENKHIFISIGYSTCHWCHVMAHESFEDEEVAKLLNDNYISIKIDKEQYPHIDKYYQSVYQIIQQKSGGWPLSVFLTSNRKPFYSETYIPKVAGYGSEGMINIINKIKKIPNLELRESGITIENILKKRSNTNSKIVKIDDKLALKTIADIKKTYDFTNNGFHKQRKFPEANKIKLLLKLYEMTNNKDALTMATLALDTMANGGIYDQIEGGFYRYTVDSKWKIPHFEKMLYTNAELIEVYTLAYKITNNELYKKTVNETIAEMDKRFIQDGVYQSASNADSKNGDGHNEEGAYFVFSFDDVLEYLEKQGLDEIRATNNLNYLGITSEGNFETDLSNSHITNNNKPKNINKTINLLKKYRSQNEYPFIDNKINTSWNALYLNAKIDASFINKKHLNSALISLDKLLNKMYINGTLYHQTVKGHKPTQKGLLEDYSFLSRALFNAYQKTLDIKYFKIYEELVTSSIKIFYKDNKWLESQDTFKTHANIDSSSYSSALGVNIINIINYSSLKAKPKIYKIAKETIDTFSSNINAYPAYYPSATMATLMQKFEPVFIKANLNKLEKINVDEIKYPFVYRYEDVADLYLACKINTCFSFGKDFNKIKKDIENLYY